MKYILLIILTIFSLFTEAETVEKSLEHSLKNINKILIFNGVGNVKITAKKNIDIVDVKYFVHMKGSEKQINNHIEHDMTIYAKANKKKLTLKFGYGKKVKKSQKKAKVDIELIVPHHIFIDLRSNDGDIDITGLTKGGRIIDKKGDIRLTNVQGAFTINDGSGDILAKGGNGKLKINDTKGDVSVNNHEGSIVINDKSGAIILNNTDGKIKIVDGSGNISIKKNVGFVKLTDKKGEINITDNQGNIKIKSTAGPLKLININGNVTLQEHNRNKATIKNLVGKVTYTK